MRIISVLILSVVFSLTARGQWAAETTVGFSYSGWNNTLTANYSLNRYQFSLGPKFNFSKAAFPWSKNLGVTSQVAYSLADSAKVDTKVFALYEILSIESSLLQEFYVGYNVDYPIYRHWQAVTKIGIGGFYENSTSDVSYSLSGITYCARLGLSYRF